MTREVQEVTRRAVLGGALPLSMGIGGVAACGTPSFDGSSTRTGGAQVLAADFGAKGDGVTNDTAALRAFFNHCVSTGRSGHISAGTYLVNAGALRFDNGYTRRAWPTISTDGYAAVKLLFADDADKPMLTLSNGTADDQLGRYWEGGGIGGFTVADRTPVAGAGRNRHALSLRGVWGAKIGWIKADGITGSAVHIPKAVYDGGNPDPYAVTYCSFDGVEANGCRGRALTNENWIGLNFCDFAAIRATNNENGALYGLGGSNSFKRISVGACRGWAVHDGAEGTIDRSLIDMLELDDVQYGIRLNAAQSVEIKRCRIIARHNATRLNPDQGYWPRVAFQLAAEPNGAIRDTTIDVILRVRPGGPRGSFGKVVDFGGSAGLANTRIAIRVLVDGAFQVTDEMLVAGYNVNSEVSLHRDGRRIVNSLQAP